MVLKWFGWFGVFLWRSRVPNHISHSNTIVRIVPIEVGQRVTRCEKYRIAKGPIAGRERSKCEANEPEKQIRKGVGTDRRTLLWIRVSSWVLIREWVQIRAWVVIRIIQMYLGSHVLEELYNFSESLFHFKRTSSVELAVSAVF